MKDNLVSVIVPTYNSSKYLKECLDSIINQTYSEIEIICIDDGSTDDTVKILNKYEYENNNIKLIKKTNTGVSDSRNIGIREANGKYIMFVDSDDFLENTMVEEMVHAIIQNDVDIVRCKAKRQNCDGAYNIEKLYGLEGKKICNDDLKECINHFVSNKESIGCYVWALLIKKENILFFNTKLFFREDTEFYIRLFMSINSAYFLDKPLYNYRYNYGSVTKNKENILRLVSGMIDSDAIIKHDLYDYRYIIKRT